VIQNQQDDVVGPTVPWVSPAPGGSRASARVIWHCCRH
jgi:hypothetical protein